MAVRLKPLARQTLVITGATSGIGLATARMAAARGARVVLAARNGEALTRVVGEITAAGGSATMVVTDVSLRADVERLAQHAIDRHGGFDTWVNNAGQTVFGALWEVSEEDHRRLFDVNFWGVVNGSVVAANHMHGRGGAIINLGSVASDVALPAQGMYSASKHAIKGYTDALRAELRAARSMISVTLIKPTSIDTPLPEHARNYMPWAPKLPPPVYTPQDVAGAILFAAEHGGRDYYIGAAAKFVSQLQKIAPGVMDWITSRIVARQQQRPEPAVDAAGTLFLPGIGGRARGRQAMATRSLYTQAVLHKLPATAIAVAAALTIKLATRRRR